MPAALLAEATLTGSVTGTTTNLATLVGQVDPPANGHITGTVSTVYVDSYDATAVLYGVTVTLEGVDVTGDLVGAVTIKDSIDDPFQRATITLEGEQYSPLVTEDTWTRLGDVVITFQQGPVGAVQSETVFTGVVDQVSTQGQTTYQLSLVDSSYLYNLTPVCYELAPLAGLSRGQIAGSLCQAAGMSASGYSIPPGQTYTKPVSAGSRKLFDILTDFGSPEGWSWRTLSDGTLEAYVPNLKLPPEQPDQEWDAGDLLERPKVTPPNNVPSRWVVRGLSAVEEDELGQEVEITTYLVEGTYAPRVAVSQQDTSGTITSTGFSSNDATRIISRITDKVTKLGGQIIRQETTEEGWTNPRHGKWHTSSGGAPGSGSAPSATEGYYYLASFIDGDGEYVKWPAEKFTEVGKRISEYTYTSGKLTRLDVLTYGYRGIPRAVRDDSSPGANLSGSVIASDDVSYVDQGGGDVDAYGLKAKQVIEYTYDDATGAVIQTEQDDYSYYRIGSRIDSGGSFYVNGDGRGHTEASVTFKLAATTKTTTLLDDSGRLAGEVDTLYAYTVTLLPDGEATYDWGGASAYRTQEYFAIRERKSKEIRVESEDSYTEITYDAEGGRDEKKLLGDPPLPTYTPSAYTRLVQTPIEVDWEDSTLEAWFGPETTVLSNDYVQTEDEARNLLARLRSRALSFEVVVDRPDSWAAPGDTVLITDREQGLAHRALVVERQRTRNLGVPQATASYSLEIPLLPWVPL